MRRCCIGRWRCIPAPRFPLNRARSSPAPASLSNTCTVTAFRHPQKNSTSLVWILTLFAETRPVHGRAVDKVFTGAFQGAVPAVGPALTDVFTVKPLQGNHKLQLIRWFQNQRKTSRMQQPTHHEPGGAVAPPCGAVTLPSVHTETGLQAAVAIETVRAGLVTVKPRPTGLAGTLPLHWVTAVDADADADRHQRKWISRKISLFFSL